MILRPALTALTLILAVSTLSAAAKTRKDQETDAVRDAIEKFKNRDKSTPNEVKAVLDDVGESPAAVAVEEDVKTSEASAAGPPVRVTGKPPTDADLTTTPTPKPPDLTTTDLTEQPPKPAEELTVQVQKLQSGNGAIDPAQVTLSAPFPAKPLAAIPVGWHLDISTSAPPFTREVEIAPGAPLTLTIHPHILVPDADNTNAFDVSEPGYHHPLGYRQAGTVGAILASSIRQLDEDSKNLGTAIDNLQQLLTSLPKPEFRPLPETRSPILRKK
jgi:hypothetical protein